MSATCRRPPAVLVGAAFALLWGCYLTSGVSATTVSVADVDGFYKACSDESTTKVVLTANVTLNATSWPTGQFITLPAGRGLTITSDGELDIELTDDGLVDNVLIGDAKVLDFGNRWPVFHLDSGANMTFTNIRVKGLTYYGDASVAANATVSADIVYSVFFPTVIFSPNSSLAFHNVLSMFFATSCDAEGLDTRTALYGVTSGEGASFAKGNPQLLVVTEPISIIYSVGASDAAPTVETGVEMSYQNQFSACQATNSSATAGSGSAISNGASTGASLTPNPGSPGTPAWVWITLALSIVVGISLIGLGTAIYISKKRVPSTPGASSGPNSAPSGEASSTSSVRSSSLAHSGHGDGLVAALAGVLPAALAGKIGLGAARRARRARPPGSAHSGSRRSELGASAPVSAPTSAPATPGHAHGSPGADDAFDDRLERGDGGEGNGGPSAAAASSTVGPAVHPIDPDAMAAQASAGVGVLAQRPTVSAAFLRSRIRHCRAAPPPNCVVGPLLGAGDFGSVHRGRWHGIPVALKIVAGRVPGDVAAWEGVVAASLNHPHVVATYEMAIVDPDAEEDQVGSAAGSKEASRSGSTEMTAEGGGRVAGPDLASVPVPPGAIPPPPAEAGAGVGAAASGAPATAASDAPATAANPSKVVPTEVTLAAAPFISTAAPLPEVLSPTSLGVAPGRKSTGSEPQIWLIMELCDRGSLADLQARFEERDRKDTAGREEGAPAGAGEADGSGPPPRPPPEGRLRTVLALMQDVASGMAYLHSLGIVHGDLKPGNVLLKSAEGGGARTFAKIGDFGLSRMLQAGLPEPRPGVPRDGGSPAGSDRGPARQAPSRRADGSPRGSSPGATAAAAGALARSPNPAATTRLPLVPSPLRMAEGLLSLSRAPSRGESPISSRKASAERPLPPLSSPPGGVVDAAPPSSRDAHAALPRSGDRATSPSPSPAAPALAAAAAAVSAPSADVGPAAAPGSATPVSPPAARPSEVAAPRDPTRPGGAAGSPPRVPASTGHAPASQRGPSRLGSGEPAAPALAAAGAPASLRGAVDEPSSSQLLNDPQLRLGTISYAPPEVMRGESAPSPSSDVYAFGIMLWEISRSQRAFAGLGQFQIVHALLNEGYRLPRPEGVPPALADLTSDCLLDDPTRRPTFEQAFDRLAQILRQ